MSGEFLPLLPLSTEPPLLPGLRFRLWLAGLADRVGTGGPRYPALDAEGQLVWGFGSFGTLSAWSIADGSLRFHHDGYLAGMDQVRAQGGVVRCFSLRSRRFVRLDAQGGRELFLRERPKDSIEVDFCVSSPDGRRALVIPRKNRVELWDVEQQKCLPMRLSQADQAMGGTLVFSPSGRRCGWQAMGGWFHVIDTESGELVGRYPRGRKKLTEAEAASRSAGPEIALGRSTYFGSDTTSVVVDDEGLACHDLATGKQRWARRLRLGNNDRFATVIGPGGLVLAQRLVDKKQLRILSLRDGSDLATIPVHEPRWDTPVFAPDGSAVLIVPMQWGGPLAIHDLPSGKRRDFPERHRGRVSELRFRKGNQQVVSLDAGDVRARLWETSTGAFVKAIPLTGARQRALVPGGELAIVGKKKALELWRLVPKKQLARHEWGHEAWSELLLSRCGSWALVLAPESEPLAWDLEQPEQLVPWKKARPAAPVVFEVFEPAQVTRYTLGKKPTLARFPLPTGMRYRPPAGRWMAPGRCLADGRSAVAMLAPDEGGDERLARWDLESGKIAWQLEETCLKGMPEHERFFVGWAQGEVAAFSVATGERLGPPGVLPCDPLQLLAFSPEGPGVAALGDGTLAIFDEAPTG